jgi:hypothetical protein
MASAGAWNDLRPRLVDQGNYNFIGFFVPLRTVVFEFADTVFHVV